MHEVSQFSGVDNAADGLGFSIEMALALDDAHAQAARRQLGRRARSSHQP